MRSARDAQEAAAEAERADDAMTRGFVCGWAATFGAVRRDVPLTGLNARRLLKLVADTGLRTWAPAAEQFERWSRSMSGDVPFSAGELRAARPALKDVGHDKIVTPVIGVLAAEAEVRNGRADEALALVEDFITEIRASGLRWQEAELLRVSGEARLLGPSADPDRAGRDLEAAVAVAREQGARAFKLRAALSLARLYQSTDRPLEARTTSSPPRSKVFRRPRNFLRSKKPRLFSLHSRNQRSEERRSISKRPLSCRKSFLPYPSRHRAPT